MNQPRAFSQFDADHETPEQPAAKSAFFNDQGKHPEGGMFEYLRSETARHPVRSRFPGFWIIGEKSDCDPALMQQMLEILPPAHPARPAMPSGKRLFDIAASLAAIIFLAPLMLMVCLAIWLTSNGPVFFAHDRIGRNGRSFRCLKFRTMRRDADEALAAHLQDDPVARRQWENAQKLTHDPRISPLGRFLRLSSIDELPQLLNVIAGDMSLVGPRPIILSECYRYGRYLDRYLELQPGLTGLWQVSGRNSVSYRRRVALDVLYNRRANFALDLWIILRTFPAIAKAEGY